jgi:hypothetical protein
MKHKFPVGHPRYGGRKKGSRTYKRALQTIEKALLEQNRNPIKEVIRLIPELNPNEQVKVWLEILTYIVPKPKAVEVDDTEEEVEVSPAVDITQIDTEELLKVLPVDALTKKPTDPS